MKKKILKTMLTMACIVPCSLALTACDNDEDKQVAHQHSYSAEWNTNSDYHWHDSTCGHADEKNGYAVHVYGNVTYTWNGMQCTASHKCATCDHEETETVTATKSVTQQADCTHEELSTLTATFTDSDFATQTKANVKTGEKLGHNYDVKGKCTRSGCTENVSMAITADNSDGDVTFTPVGDKIYFNFTTIKGKHFSIDTETQQKLNLETEINENTPRLIKSVKMYNEDGTLEFELTNESGDDNNTYKYFYWESNEELSAETKYYCVVTLDKEYDEFVAYVSAVEKYSDSLTFTNETSTKEYDGTPFTVTATSSQGLDVTIEYSTDEETWTTTAPTDAGTYYVKASTEDTATIEGDEETSTFIIEPKEIFYASGASYATNYNGTKSYLVKVIASSVKDGALLADDNLTVKYIVTCSKPLDAGSMYTIYNGYTDGDGRVWSIALTDDSNPNYTLTLDADHKLKLTITTLSLTVNSTFVSEQLSGYEYTFKVSGDMCTNELTTENFAGATLSVAQKSVSTVAVGTYTIQYDSTQSKWLDQNGAEWDLGISGSSKYSALSQESIITLNVLAVDSIATYSTMFNMDADEYKAYKVTIADAGLYSLGCSFDSDAVSMSILEENPISGNYYYLTAGEYTVQLHSKSNVVGVSIILDKVAEMASAPTAKTSEIMSDDGYIDDYSSYTADDEIFYKVYVKETGIYQLLGDQFIEASILGVTAPANTYYLQRGTYIVKLVVRAEETDQTVKLTKLAEVDEPTNITNSLLSGEFAYIDDAWISDKIYYYYLDISNRSVVNLAFDCGGATVTILGKTPVYGHSEYELYEGRYIIKVDTSTGYSEAMEMCTIVYRECSISVGTAGSIITAQDCEEIGFRVYLTEGTHYAFANDCSVKPEDVFCVYKMNSEELLSIDYFDSESTDEYFTVSTTGYYYIYAYTTDAGTQTLKIVTVA